MQWKWRDNSSDSTQEISGSLVAEVSEDSHAGLQGDRFHQTFTGIGLSEEYGTWSDNLIAEAKIGTRSKSTYPCKRLVESVLQHH